MLHFVIPAPLCIFFAPFVITAPLCNYFARLLEAVVKRCSVKKVSLKISEKSQENTCASLFFKSFLPVNFIKKETLVQVFSCEFCEIFKNTFFHWTPPVAASGLCNYAVLMFYEIFEFISDLIDIFIKMKIIHPSKQTLYVIRVHVLLQNIFFIFTMLFWSGKERERLSFAWCIENDVFKFDSLLLFLILSFMFSMCF